MSAGASGGVMGGEALAAEPASLDLAVSVVRGHPDDEELVALVAALTVLSRRAAAAEADAAPAEAVSPWRHGAGLRRELVGGPDAWRAALR